MTTSSSAHHLRAAGLRATPARLGILAILEEASHPLDVETIYATLQQKKLRTNPVTVYRVLDQLLKKKLVKRIDFMEGKFRYDTINHHHHVICRQCHIITPVEECTLEALEHEIEAKYHVQIDQHQLEFYGLCAGCC